MFLGILHYVVGLESKKLKKCLKTSSNRKNNENLQAQELLNWPLELISIRFFINVVTPTFSVFVYQIWADTVMDLCFSFLFSPFALSLKFLIITQKII